MYATTKAGKLFQHWPHLSDRSEPQVCVGKDYSEADLWSDLARHTLRAEGGVLVVGLYSNDKRHHVIREQLAKAGDVDFSRVVHPHIEPILRKITVQAREAYRGGLENVETGEVAWHDVPARKAGVETKTFNKRFHLGSRRNLQLLITAVNERATVRSILKSYSGDEIGGCPISAVLIMESNLDEGDLDYLQDFRAACPGVDVYIFHRWDATKHGVEVTGDVDNWENEFPALSECEFEPPQVIVDDLLIKGNIHVAAGRFEAFKTMALIELFSAVLDQRPAFDHFTVRQRYPVLFLCADMSRELFNEYASPFNVRKHGADFRVLKANAGIPDITDPVLQKAVHGRILVLDTMLDFAKIQKAFESGEWITFMQNLRDLMTVHGCIAIVMTAHATKAGAKSNTIDPSEYLKDSVTFGGKIDVGYAFSKLDGTSQVFVERIKSRGFKKALSFTITVNDADGESNLDRGRFPVYLKPGEAGKKQDHVAKPGRPADPDLQAKFEFAKSVGGSYQEMADAVNEKFKTNHVKSTVMGWFKKFDKKFDEDKQPEI
jgi:AAA domain